MVSTKRIFIISLFLGIIALKVNAQKKIEIEQTKETQHKDFREQEGETESTNSKIFVRLQKKLDGSFYKTINGKLYVQYKEEYNTNTLTFKVYNELNREEVISTAPIHFRGYGENGIEFDFSNLPVKKYYVLEIINPKDEKWYLRFFH